MLFQWLSDKLERIFQIIRHRESLFVSNAQQHRRLTLPMPNIAPAECADSLIFIPQQSFLQLSERYYSLAEGRANIPQFLFRRRFCTLLWDSTVNFTAKVLRMNCREKREQNIYSSYRFSGRELPDFHTLLRDNWTIRWRNTTLDVVVSWR